MYIYIPYGYTKKFLIFQLEYKFSRVGFMYILKTLLYTVDEYDNILYVVLLGFVIKYAQHSTWKTANSTIFVVHMSRGLNSD